jgi:hypothetical protein
MIEGFVDEIEGQKVGWKPILFRRTGDGLGLGWFLLDRDLLMMISES